MSCGLWGLSSPTRNRTQSLAVKAQSSNHGTTRERPGRVFITEGRKGRTMEKANRSVVANSLGGKGEKAVDGAQGISGSEGVVYTIMVDITGICQNPRNMQYKQCSLVYAN